MSKIVSRRNHIGIIGIIITIVTIISIFAYLSFYSGMNVGFIGNNFVSNTKSSTNHSIDNTDNSQTDDNTPTTLVAVWIGLMIIGSFLLYHIHFKVLPRE